MVDMTSNVPQQINSGNTTRMESQAEADERAALFTAELANAVPRAWAEVRTKRNGLIAATDWRFRSDQTPSQAWIDYCQALRDITDQPDPNSIVWPVEPL